MSDCPWKKAFLTHAKGVVAGHQIPGLAFGISREGEVLIGEGVGFRNVDERLPTGPDTVYGIGSITKSFTCLAIMQLQERGLLSLDDPVVEWLPEFSLPGDASVEGITLHHFMTHTSGLPPLRSLYHAMIRSMKADPSAEEALEKMKDLEPIDTYEDLLALIPKLDFELLGEPGKYFSYSNDGYALLGAVIERAAGVSYADYLDDNILGPLGMEHTTMNMDKVQNFEEVTELYTTKNEEGKQMVHHSPGWWEFPAMEAAGRLMSTVNDLLRYLEVYRCRGTVGGEQIVSEDSIALMMHPHASIDGSKDANYGYGLTVQQNYHGVTLVGHGGGIKGVSADILLAVEDNLTAAALSNLAGVPSASVTLGAINTLKEMPPDTRRHEFEDFDATEEQLDRFAGTYSSGEGAQVKLYTADGYLFGELEDRTYIARPIAADRVLFNIGSGEMVVGILTDEDDEVFAITLGYRIIPKVQASD